jgi:hypothetical protein
MNKSPNGSCHFCKDPENLMHLFVNCKLVDSVWTEIFQKINEFYEQNEIKTISKSENSIILGISHRDDQINAIVNTILTTTKWMIWKERNVAKYQKKKITKLKIINLIKSEISFIFSLVKSKTGNNIYTEMTNMFCIHFVVVKIVLTIALIWSSLWLIPKIIEFSDFDIVLISFGS